MEDKIIKGSTAAGFGVRKVVKQEVYSAALEAKDIVGLAREQAEQVLKDAQEEAAAVLEKAREEGYAQGLARWNQAVTETAAAREKIFKDSEQEIIRLALRIAEKIIGERLDSSPETMVTIVREALKSVHRERNLIIKVHPDYADQVRNQVAALIESTGGQREIQVLAAPNVSPGGCVVESEFGVIDARLETQLKCLEDILLRTGN